VQSQPSHPTCKEVPVLDSVSSATNADDRTMKAVNAIQEFVFSMYKLSEAKIN